MKQKEIEHRGKVVDMTQNIITVEFISKSACSSCHAKSACMASDEKVKVLELDNRVDYDFEIGEEVIICLSPTLGYKAIWLSYVIPLVILLVLLLSLQASFEKDLYTGLVSVSALALYYFIIYLCRGKISKEFVFTLRKLNK